MTALEATPPACPGCGLPIRPGAKFCPRCGGEVPHDEPAVSPEPPEPAVPPETARVARTAGFAARGTWSRFRPALWFLVLLLTASGIGLAAGAISGSDTPWLDVGITLLHAAIFVAFAWTERESVGPALARHGFGPAAFVAVPALFWGLAGFMFLYVAGLSALGVESLGYLEPFRDHGWPLWSAFALVSVCPAIFEEIGFRGFLQGRLESILGPGEAIVLQAALFSVFHLSPLIFVSHFVMGLAFGWLRRRTGSLYPGMVLHAVWNAAVLTVEMLG